LVVLNSRFALLRRKAPQIIAAAIIIVIAVYVLFELLEDVFVEGAPLTSGPLVSAIISFTRDVTATVSSWGYSGIFVLMLLESSSLPVPSEVILPFAGYLVFKGQLNFWVTVIVATAAGVAGSLVDYYIGLKGVQALAKRRILGRVLFSMDQLAFAAIWFNRYGAIMVFVGRLIPGFRTLVSFPAGAVKMSLAKFVAFTTAGCILWNTVLIYVGYYLGIKWREVADVSHYAIIGVIAVFVVLIAAYLMVRRRKKKIRFASAQ
jgi:membrane protein DedA with SNARE-associated domain